MPTTFLRNLPICRGRIWVRWVRFPMVVHFFLHLRQHDWNTLIGEQTIGSGLFNTGTFRDILQVNITAGSICVEFQDAADEHIRISTSWILSIFCL